MTPKTPTGLEPEPGVRQPLPHGAPPSAAGTPPPPRSSGRGWIWLLVIAALAGGGYYFWQRNNSAAAGTAPEPGVKTGKKGGRGMGGPPPVVAVHARRGNIGVYVNDPGNVIPIYTVTVKSRVDGELMNVYFKEGDMVQKGQELVQIDSRPFEVSLEQAQGQLARDQALLANSKVDLARYETLITQNAIPQQQLDTQKALVAQYEGTVKTDAGNIDSAKLNITYCHIGAPITGRVGLRLVDPGNIVHASDPNGLLVITQMQPISVIFPISERDLPEVRKRFHGGQHLTVEAWDQDGKSRIAIGTLSTIDNQIDQSTGTVKLRAEFDNQNNELFPNQMINSRLLVQMKKGAILIPTAAVQRTSSTAYVWLLKPDDTVTVRDITIGTEEGDMSEVTSGIAAGDAVVMTGVDKLNEGSKVIPNFQDSGGRGGRSSGPDGQTAGGGPGGQSPNAGRHKNGGQSSQ